MRNTIDAKDGLILSEQQKLTTSAASKDKTKSVDSNQMKKDQRHWAGVSGPLEGATEAQHHSAATEVPRNLYFTGFWWYCFKV